MSVGRASAPVLRRTTILDTAHGPFRLHTFEDARTRLPALALTRGDVADDPPLLARVHSSCITSETFGGCDCDCADQLASSLARIAREGRGVLFYLLQEGRGAGFLAKARDRMLVQASGHRITTFEAYERMGLGRDGRRYDAVPAMAERLGIRAPLVLMTNNPEKRSALERAGLRAAGVAPVEPSWSPFNLHYVAAKRRSGHALVGPARAPEAAALPEPVRAIEPRPLPGAPGLEHVATYLLPVRANGSEAPPLWLRLHAYGDREGGGERVAFTYGDPTAPDAPVRVLRENLLERFPMPAERFARSQRARWLRALALFVRVGAGIAVFAARRDAGVEALVAHHRRWRGTPTKTACTR